MRTFNSTSRAPSQTRQQGFSLIELSLVLAIFVILVGFAMPRFSLFLESDLEKEAGKLAKIIDDLRVQAILQGNTYQIEVDTNTSEYTILVESPDTPGRFETVDEFPKPIRLSDTVKIKKFEILDESATKLRFAGRRIEFDKLFGQSYKFRVDYMGFVDMITVTFIDQSEELALSVVNIMGKTEIRPPQSSTI